MELQWELIIFTTLVAWSAGLFASQCVLALKGEAARAQMPAWVCAAALLVVGGVAVFFHLEHWERIFNGFGHLSSGITQELIAIVVLAVVAVVYLVFLRKGKVPAWLAGLGIAVSAVLVVVMAHSYVMAARPAWDSVMWILAVLGGACVLGPATMSVIVDIRSEESSLLGKIAVAGAAVNAVGTVAYVAAAASGVGVLSEVQYYVDHTDPTEPLLRAAQFGPFADGIMVVTVVALAAAVIALALAFAGLKKGGWKVWGSACVVFALVGAVALRVAFYQMGASVFMIF